MKKYYNSKTNSWYREGSSLTISLEKGLFSGIPTEEQLAEWGYKEVKDPIPQPLSEDAQASIDRQYRMEAIKAELGATDYIVLKSVEGYDVSEYGDWKEKRQALRDEYNRLEKEQEEYHKSFEPVEPEIIE